MRGEQLSKPGQRCARTEELHRLVEQVEQASSQVVAGNATPFKTLWSQQDDVTLFGGRGGYEQGWEQINARLDWVAADFHEGFLSYHALASGVSGDVAYSIGIERGQIKSPGEAHGRPLTLRVTHLYRREHGVWKLIHRHADTAMDQR